jgi:hypothetical protein
MIYSANPLERRLQVSGTLLILGLMTEGVCLFWARPLSFLAFITIGGAFLFLGVIVYLLALLPTKRSSKSGDS